MGEAEKLIPNRGCYRTRTASSFLGAEMGGVRPEPLAETVALSGTLEYRANPDLAVSEANQSICCDALRMPALEGRHSSGRLSHSHQLNDPTPAFSIPAGVWPEQSVPVN